MLWGGRFSRCPSWDRNGLVASLDMQLWGLTGGIATGKSTVTAMFQERGWVVVDTDQLARDAVVPGSEGLRAIVEEFGGEVIDSSGCLRRSELARLAFGDEGARQRLEAILHPRIRSLWKAEVVRWRQQGVRAGLVVIPLLYETDAAGSFDGVFCTACSGVTQRERMAARGWGSAEAEARLRAQWSLSRKMALADRVLWTEGMIEVTVMQVDRILRQLNLHPLF